MSARVPTGGGRKNLTWHEAMRRQDAAHRYWGESAASSHIRNVGCLRLVLERSLVIARRGPGAGEAS